MACRSPEELARREDRLAKLAQARAKIEARAKERFEREAAEHRAELGGAGGGGCEWQEGRRQATRTAGRGAAAQGPDQPDGREFADYAGGGRRLRPVLQRAGGGGDGELMVIATAVVQAPNDKQQIAPMLEKIDALSEQFGRPETLLADNGYFSEANVM